MDVSVIIPNYRHAPYLKERIDSVLNQTFRDFEVIILDDCSPDASREVIERYRSHPQVTQIVYNRENSGSPFLQWQRGFALARGRYLWIAESDDAAEPTFLETCVAQLERNPKAVLAFTDCRYIDENSNPSGFTDFSRQLARHRGGETRFGERTFFRRLHYMNYVQNASMALFRKSALPADTTYATFRYVGDWLFWLEVARRGEVIYIDKPLDLFRRHAESTTQKSTAGGRNYLEILRLLQYVLPQAGLSAAYREFLFGKFLVRLDRDLRKEKEEAAAVRRAWREAVPHPVRSIVWYRIAKMLRIYPL